MSLERFSGSFVPVLSSHNGVEFVHHDVCRRGVRKERISMQIPAYVTQIQILIRTKNGVLVHDKDIDSQATSACFILDFFSSPFFFCIV